MNAKRVEVLFSPAEYAALGARDLAATASVVFDILRATTTMMTALANGAREIIPVAEIPEALALRVKDPNLLLAGERGGARIRADQTGSVDFDFGNSPREFTSAKVNGRRIAITTTNGTRALRACAHGAEIHVGSFINMQALARALAASAQPNILIVCAGTAEEASFEDTLAAGALCNQLTGANLRDSAQIALATYQRHEANLLASMSAARNGRKLLSLPDLAADVPICLQQNTLSVTARMHTDGAIRLMLLFFAFLLFTNVNTRAAADRLPNTELLTTPGDLASNLVAGVDRFLLKQLADSEQNRARHWHRDFSSLEAYDKSVQTNRDRFAKIIGARDRDLSFAPKLNVSNRRIVQNAGNLQIETFHYAAFGDVSVEGIIIWPGAVSPQSPQPCVVAIPDADLMPEQLAGLYDGVPAVSQYARILAESGCVVVVPSIVNRRVEKRRNAYLTNREFLYRPAFELGRNLVGYETLKVLALIEAVLKSPWCNGRIGVMGWGEGGFIALSAAALEKKIDAVVVSGFFDDRRNVWEQPIDRNVFGLLDEFGDAELASLIAPRTLIVEACQGPEVLLKGGGGAPGKLETPKLASVQREIQRARALLADLKAPTGLELVVSGDGSGPFGSPAAIQKLLDRIAPGSEYKSSSRFEVQDTDITEGRNRDTNHIHELDRHNQWLLTESPYVRAEFMKKLDVSSPEKYAATSAEYRDYFYKEVIGKFDLPLMAANPHSRRAYDTEKWTGYEVTLDVFPDVIAYGILLLPKDLKPGERRPVVVCQHGLEGRPQDVVTGDSPYYHDFAAKLAERGFITFAPQNLYIFTDRFRTLQRKANPLGKTLFSIITPQHQQIVNWLKTLPNVDPSRIGFYGLSYGGKTAMRVPALVTDYALSICSADFNDWVWKNASTRSPYSYVWTGEYEIFEFDLGSTFNYAEMAALIAPRPFMVERGHFDGVAPDETVGYEFAKVQNLYAARLKLPADRCQIEWFVGPHTINGQGTFDFLHKHLNWPKR